jgi:ABC-type branched-subunit amino acid transport system substrate-binding protein
VFGLNSQVYAASQKTITIGIMSCISGGQAVIGNKGVYGAEQAIEYVNKNQMLGKDIQLKGIIMDDQLNATVGMNAYQRVKDKILALIVYDTSGACALRPFVEQDKIPWVPCTTNRSFIYPPSKYVFGLAMPYEELMVGFLKAAKAEWKEDRAPKLGLVSFDVPSGRVAISAAKKYGKELGWEIGPISVVSLSTVDFSGAIDRIREEKPDWIQLSLTGGQMSNFFSQVKVAGLKDEVKWLLPLWAGFCDATTLAVSPEKLDGVHGYEVISHLDVHAGAKEWAEWTKANGGSPSDESGNSTASAVFVITRAIQLALEKVSVDELDGQKLSEYGFQRIKDFQMFGDLMPPVTYGPNNSRGINKACILQMVDGKVQTNIDWFDVPVLKKK